MKNKKKDIILEIFKFGYKIFGIKFNYHILENSMITEKYYPKWLEPNYYECITWHKNENK